MGLIVCSYGVNAKPIVNMFSPPPTERVVQVKNIFALANWNLSTKQDVLVATTTKIGNNYGFYN